MEEDIALLHRYVREKSDTAFAELVKRHLQLVYSVALRQVGGDVHLAEDVAQQVFTSLARKARALLDRPSLGGWLYRSTHFAASDVVRRERRRRAREQEAQTMHDDDMDMVDASTTVDWERLRPAIDAAVAELEERDRDAISLRFLEERTFAEVGARLHLTENAARMRVERALDKLHAAMTRRGVHSTAAALALALGHQISAAVPAGLATAIAGAAVTGTGGVAAGLVSFVSTTKFIGGIGVGVSAAALGVAVVQHRDHRAAEQSLAVEQQRREATQGELETLRTRLADAERRASDADRDNVELLKAIESTRDGRSPVTGSATRVAAATTPAPAEDERAVEARKYQQDLARRRAEEAKTRAETQMSAAAEADALKRFHLLIEAAEQRAALAEFQPAIRLYNEAMQIKPAGLEISERVRALQAMLERQNTPVDVTLLSDWNTWVQIRNFRAPEKFGTSSVRILPGNYEITGRRKGYRDVVMQLRVRGGEPVAPVTIICREAAKP